MIDKALNLLAPHHCCGCQKIGRLLCDDCKYNINNEHNFACLACLRPCGASGICTSCVLPYSRAWWVGKRQGELEKLVDVYKFERVKSANIELADLMVDTLPSLPGDLIVVSVPTVASHIRNRGYDHMKIISRRLAKKLGLQNLDCLDRLTTATQHGATASQRVKQAKVAFGVNKKFIKDTTYLLIDDVFTTGSTVRYAAERLKEAGAKDVWVAVIARQTID